MQLDVRLPMGMMFVIIGVILSLYGLITWSDAEMYQRSLGYNVNLWWGLFLAAFARRCCSLGARRDPRKRDAATPDPVGWSNAAIPVELALPRGVVHPRHLESHGPRAGHRDPPRTPPSEAKPPPAHRQRLTCPPPVVEMFADVLCVDLPENRHDHPLDRRTFVKTTSAAALD